MKEWSRDLRRIRRRLSEALCALLFVTVGLAVVQSGAAADSGAGKLSMGIQGLQHTLDAMRYGDLRPTQHTDFGVRVELSYGVWRGVGLSVAGHQARSHFHYDTGFEQGNWRDSDWGIEVGPTFRVGDIGRAEVLLGGSLFYVEAQSRLTVRDTFGSHPIDGPETFMVGGTGRLVLNVPLFSRLEGTTQLGVGVVKARAKAPGSGNLYEWNGRSLGAALGLRVVLLRGSTAGQ